MRGIIFAILMLTQLTACAAAAPKQAAAREYRSAIESAEIQEGYDRRYEFHRCIRNWEIAAPDRSARLREILKGRNELKSDGILLEIGGSTWARYDFILVENTRLKSNFVNAAEIDISGTALQKRLDAMSAPDLADLKGRAYSGAMDAPCYFLSLRKGTSSRSVVIYGSLGAESADSLIKELLAAVGKPRAEPLLP